MRIIICLPFSGQFIPEDPSRENTFSPLKTQDERSVSGLTPDKPNHFELNSNKHRGLRAFSGVVCRRHTTAGYFA